MEDTKIAIVQIENNIYNIKTNLNKIIDYIVDASKQGAKFIVFGECALTGYAINRKNIQTISLDDKYIQKLIEIALTYKITIFLGANTKENNNIYNTYLMIKDNGEVVNYNKTHLGKKENEKYKQGDELTIFKTENIQFGTATCIESHIPEIFLTHRLNGSEIMLLPFASTSNCGNRQDIWKKYILSRGYDYGQYIICVNLTGVSEGYSFTGGIMVVNPKGDIVYEYYSKEEKMVVIELNEHIINSVRKDISKTNFIKRRRPELYNVKNNNEYIKNPNLIEDTSFEIIGDEGEELLKGFNHEEQMIVKRVIHTTADFEYANLVEIHPNAIEVAKKALLNKCKIYSDTSMIISGVNKRKLKDLNVEICNYVHDEDVYKMSKDLGMTRSMAGIIKAVKEDDIRIYAIGNAPTAIYKLKELIENGNNKPDLIIGAPVGFVGAKESKEILSDLNIPYIRVNGRKGGSTVVVAIINAILKML